MKIFFLKICSVNVMVISTRAHFWEKCGPTPHQSHTTANQGTWVSVFIIGKKLRDQKLWYLARKEEIVFYGNPSFIWPTFKKSEVWGQFFDLEKRPAFYQNVTVPNYCLLLWDMENFRKFRKQFFNGSRYLGTRCSRTSLVSIQTSK